MQKEKGKRKKAKSLARRGWRSPFFFLFPFSFFLCLTGCADDGRLANNDPLLGGPAMRPGAGKLTPAQPTALRPLPPVLSPSPATSNAALAAGPPKLPLDPTHDLRIGSTPNAIPTSGAWQDAATGSGVVLQPPKPLAESVSENNSTGGGGVVGTSGIRLTSYEQAEAQLAGRGTKWQRLEHANGEWKFTCSLPGRQDPNVNRTYEATGPDHLTAIQRVLDKIQAEQ